MPPLLALCLWLFLDGATLAVATTPLVLHYAPRIAPWQAAVAGGAASALGSTVQLAALRWMLAHERPWMLRLLPARRAVSEALARHPSASFAAIAIARATPLPDAPVKLAAAAGGYPLARYGLAALLGGMPYYGALAWFGHRFPLPGWLVAAIAGVFVAGLVADRLRARGASRA